MTSSGANRNTNIVRKMNGKIMNGGGGGGSGFGGKFHSGREWQWCSRAGGGNLCDGHTSISHFLASFKHWSWQKQHFSIYLKWYLEGHRQYSKFIIIVWLPKSCEGKKYVNLNYFCAADYLRLPKFPWQIGTFVFGQVLPPRHSDQMSQRSQMLMNIIWRCSLMLFGQFV